MSLQPGSSSGSPLEGAGRKSNKIGRVTEESRKMREENMIRMRKTEPQNILLRKRINISGLNHQLMEALPEIIERVCAEYPDHRLEVNEHFRRLTVGEEVPVDEVLKKGILPHLVGFLSRDDAPQLQREALWIVSNFNFASGTSQQITAIVELGVVPPLVNLLSSTDEDTREEVVFWNIVRDSANNRDLVLNHGALMPILGHLQPQSKLSMLRLASWCLSLLLRGEPPVSLEQIKPALPVLQRLVHMTDEEILTDTCWALAYFSVGETERSQAILDLGICPRLLELLQHPSDTITLTVLLFFGNIVTYNNGPQTRFLIDIQLLRRLRRVLMREYNKSIFREACWTISNIASGHRDQFQVVIDANIIDSVVKVVHNAGFEVKIEAAWVICNITFGGYTDHIRYLAAHGCIEALCELLTYSDLAIVRVCLLALDSILGVGESDRNDRGNSFAKRVEQCGGLDNIEMLQTHDNNEISKTATLILVSYFAEAEMDE
ncbi:unnamed protein product [Sphenostylis stenocarpa]|uniref:Importin subunit alpha n=1 Tax=Sphenostylis stenocarpa TaxID=92480 RepID=A0AA86SCR0_9FABA|nr:unnamed protein product [Sphenostylis stenocarpa]